MGIEFGNAALLFGASLFAVPLIIHLLNRRRYRPKAWAAMDFLLAAYKRTRRRLRLENFLLLLIRCLIIILLALAMAKPFVSSESAVAALTTVRRDVVVVLDDSYSMGYQLTPDETCFDFAKKKISALLGRLDSARGDTVTMILMGNTPEFAVPFHSSPQEALIKLERLREPALREANFPALVDLLAGEVTAAIQGKKEVYIFTDLQARTLGSGIEGGWESTAALLNQAVEADMQIQFVDVGDPSSYPQNTVVTQVGTLEPYVTTEVPTTFIAMVQNFSETEIPDCRGTFVLDGEPVESRSVKLRPGSSASVECTITLHEAGFHHISFRLEADNLPVDDERWYAFDARHTVRVLLVDGRYRDDPLERATGELMWVINPARIDGSRDRGTVFEPEVMDFKIFNAGRTEINRYDCIILADVEGLSTEMTGALIDYTRSGGSLVFFMGEEVDLAAWNQRLLSGDGPHLLPARLEAVMGDELGAEAVDYFQLSVADSSHPLFALFNDPRYRVLLDVPVFRFVRIGDVAEEARVIARLVDSLDRSYPAVVENVVGQGRVLFFAFAADSSWSLIPERPALFLPMVHNMLYHLTARDAGLFNLGVGDVLSRSVVDLPETISLLDPSGFREEITEQVERRALGRYVLPLSNRALDQAGPYYLEVDFSLTGDRVKECYTANVDPLEGNLKRFDEAQLVSLFPDADLRVVDSALLDEKGYDEDAGKGEFWKPLLILLLILVGLELMLSWKFGNYQ
ncbi:MAG: BatA domain-containing protein [Planctomycetota bacterium]